MAGHFSELTAIVPFGYTLEISTGEHDLHEGIWTVKLRDWDGHEVSGQTTAVTLDNPAGALSVVKLLLAKHDRTRPEGPTNGRTPPR